MKLILIITCLLFAGCDANIHNYEIAGYTKACKDNGGLAKINNLNQIGICTDGTRVDWYAK